MVYGAIVQDMIELQAAVLQHATFSLQRRDTTQIQMDIMSDDPFEHENENLPVIHLSDASKDWMTNKRHLSNEKAKDAVYLLANAKDFMKSNTRI